MVWFIAQSQILEPNQIGMKFNLYLLTQENWTPESKMWAPHIPRVPLTFTPSDLLILVVETVHFESFGLVSLAVDRPV